MSLKVGIVGLPNVGKSTLFNALTKSAEDLAQGKAAKAQNVPFTTIDPNVGVVTVPDERLEVLAKISKSEKVVPTTVEFVDIAGLVKKAHQGEGLGNQFLANIREVDAIAHVVRFFDNSDILHVEGGVDPERDVETIDTELVLADLATVEKMMANLEKKVKGDDKEARALMDVLVKLKDHLGAGLPARDLQLEEEEAEIKKSVSLLTDKPVLYVANVGEEEVKTPPSLPLSGEEFVVSLSVKIEQELMELPEEERESFLAEYGLKEAGLDRLVQASYKLLDLITFFTSGPTETRAWTVRRGSKAPQAAGQVHSDMERGFIRAETVAFEDLAEAGSYAEARARGKVRDEGKEYVVRDGDVMLFKFSG